MKGLESVAFNDQRDFGITMAEQPFVVGVDVGGTNVRAAVVEHGTGKIVARSLNIPSHAMDGAQYTVQQIAEGVRQAMDNADITTDQIGGVGIAVPGHVKPDEGKILWAPNFKDQWHDVLLAQPVSGLLKLPVHIGNDANLAALGEFTYGAGKGTKHLVMLTVGTGIGSGVIVNGKLLTGANGGAAEMGHMFIAAGPQARGGKAMFGTLEGLAQIDAIVERAARKVATGRKTILTDGEYDRMRLTPKMLWEAATAGDAVALETFEETGYYLGLGVASAINIFNPEIVVIGGGVAQSGAVLMEPTIRSARVNSIGTMYKTCRIVQADLGDNAGIMGAAALVIHEALPG